MLQNYNNILIFGYSKSGKSAEIVLNKYNKKYKIYDDNIKLNGGNYISKICDKEIKKFDLIILSPGVSIYHKMLVKAEKFGIKIVSELELGFWLCKCKIIAVTGTNGKTTTVGLINHMLNKNGFKSNVFGNIGVPFSSVWEYENLDYAIVEVSSFQLESTQKFRANITVILNIDQDHIDRHKSIENYANIKMSILKCCNKNDIAILNFDDEIIMQKESQYKMEKKYISTKNIVDGLYVSGESLYCGVENYAEEICSVNEFSNFPTFLHNIMVVVIIGKILNIETLKILNSFNTFEWFRNRLEVVGKINSIRFVNDSKGTNIHATLSAINQYKNTNLVLILGGKDKSLDYNKFFSNIPCNVKKIVFFGEAYKSLYNCAKRYINKTNLFKCKNLESAVIVAYNISNEYEVVLFSPSCASFDAYKNYAERGEHFKNIVNKLDNDVKSGVFKKARVIKENNFIRKMLLFIFNIKRSNNKINTKNYKKSVKDLNNKNSNTGFANFKKLNTNLKGDYKSDNEKNKHIMSDINEAVVSDINDDVMSEKTDVIMGEKNDAIRSEDNKGVVYEKNDNILSGKSDNNIHEKNENTVYEKKYKSLYKNVVAYVYLDYESKIFAYKKVKNNSVMQNKVYGFIKR